MVRKVKSLGIVGTPKSREITQKEKMSIYDEIQKERWKQSFITEFRKGITQGDMPDDEYEKFLRDEASIAYDNVGEAESFNDPVEAAQATLYAIKVLS